MNSSFPKEWTSQFIHFIPNPNGLDVRPITLSSCLCKFLETEKVEHRLEWWIEVNEILPETQSGSRKRRSCHDDLSNLLYTDYDLNKNRETIAVFIDIKSAFDNLNTSILVDEAQPML